MTIEEEILILEKKIEEGSGKIDERYENEIIKNVFEEIREELEKQKKENKRIENFFIGKLIKEKKNDYLKINKRQKESIIAFTKKINYLKNEIENNNASLSELIKKIIENFNYYDYLKKKYKKD